MNLLIAGYGRLGQALSALLLNASDAVTITAINRSGSKPADIRFVRADLNDATSLMALAENIDAIVYCPTPDERTPDAYQRTYISGLQNLANSLASRPWVRLIFVSSTAVYSQTDGSWVHEDSLTEPAAFNGRILLEAERHARSLFPDSCCLRLSGLYSGLSQRYRQWLNDIPSAETLGRWTNRIHVSDAAQLIALLLAADTIPPIVLGNDDRPVQAVEILEWLASTIDGLSLTTALPSPIVNGKRVSNQHARSLGFVPAYPDYRSGFSIQQ